MKSVNLLLKILIPLLIVVSTAQLKSQFCNPSFSYTIGQNGSVTFANASTPSVGAISYSLNFGASYIPTFVGSPFTFTPTTVTYTTNGPFVVTLVMTNTPACSQTFTAQITIPTCSINVTSTSSSSVPCLGSATASASGFCGPVTYSWSNSGVGPSQFSLCPGSYTVLASGSNPSCCPTTSAVVTVATTNTCTLLANFQTTVSPGGVVNFRSTSTGTTASTIYNWTFGDNTNSITTVPIITHTYSTNGFYTAFLTAVNNSVNCFDTSNTQVVAPNLCNLSATILATYNSNGTPSFSCAAVGTNSSTTFSWNFGDGNTSSGQATAHTYSSSQLYTVQVFVNNNGQPPCTALDSIIINGACNIAANISHTVGSSGLVNFNSQASGSVAGSTYLWDFGDGYGDITPNPTHQYTNGGTHYVSLIINNNYGIFCQDSAMQAINITGIACTANANFALYPSTTPQYWYATPAYPYNVTNAKWNWGDGSISNTLYTSHTYSAAGNYSICLSVTVSCNTTATYCFTQYISKPSRTSGLAYINVLAPKLALSATMLTSDWSLEVYPNPSSGDISIKLPDHEAPIAIKITDLSGRLVYEKFGVEESFIQVRTSLSKGLYLLSVEGGSQTKQVKLIIQD